MSICEQLKISESFFDGYELPLTIQDALIFFSTEIEDLNNIPHHIKLLLTVIRENPDMTDEVLIHRSDISWFTEQASFYINQANGNKNSMLESIYKVFNLAIDHFDIYKKLCKISQKNFIVTCQEKINEIFGLDYFKCPFNKNHPCYHYYEKCHQLQDLHIRYDLIDESMIFYRRDAKYESDNENPEEKLVEVGSSP
jgi:hypothetical protein